jgi:hypothetical protein
VKNENRQKTRDKRAAARDWRFNDRSGTRPKNAGTTFAKALINERSAPSPALERITSRGGFLCMRGLRLATLTVPIALSVRRQGSGAHRKAIYFRQKERPQ